MANLLLYTNAHCSQSLGFILELTIYVPTWGAAPHTDSSSLLRWQKVLPVKNKSSETETREKK